MDYDPDQNFQIETHYQECKKGKSEFGSKHIIVGDMKKVKNGFLYSFWGKSSDPSSWV
jgi:hypothetical protein